MIDVLQMALEDLGISTELYSAAQSAGEDVANHKFDAVIVDFDVAGATDFLRGVRTSHSNSHTLTFAIVSPDVGLPHAFQLGANLALQKPVSVDAARSSLRAAYSLIMQERRRYFRVPVETTVYLYPNENYSIVATSMNVSEGGMSIKCDHELQVNGLVKLSFFLPGVKKEIESRAVVVWRDSVGRAGLRFEPMSPPVRQALDAWVSEHAMR